MIKIPNPKIEDESEEKTFQFARAFRFLVDSIADSDPKAVLVIEYCNL
jgi:hypothetical protein